MTVREAMSPDPATCAPQDDLGTVASIMRGKGCGFLPVVDVTGSVVGVITDRDVCMAAEQAHRTLTRVSAGETMTPRVFSCSADDNLKAVLGKMGNHRVRRLPVVDEGGRLQGVLSLDDIVRAPYRRGAPTAEEIVGALKLICSPLLVETAS